MGDERAVDPLIRMADRGGAEKLIVYAVTALTRINSDGARLGLIQILLRLAYTRAYGPALEALVKAGDSWAIPKLRFIVEAGPFGVVFRTATALRQLGDTSLVPQFLEELVSSDSSMREWVAEVLGGFGDRRAVGPLVGALSDTDWEVRSSAARSLGAIGDAGAVESLIGLLTDEAPYVRRDAGYALERLGAGRQAVIRDRHARVD